MRERLHADQFVAVVGLDSEREYVSYAWLRTWCGFAKKSRISKIMMYYIYNTLAVFVIKRNAITNVIKPYGCRGAGWSLRCSEDVLNLFVGCKLTFEVHGTAQVGIEVLHSTSDSRNSDGSSAMLHSSVSNNRSRHVQHTLLCCVALHLRKCHSLLLCLQVHPLIL